MVVVFVSNLSRRGACPELRIDWGGSCRRGWVRVREEPSPAADRAPVDVGLM